MARSHFLDSYNDIFGPVFYDNYLTPFIAEAITLHPEGAYKDDIYKSLTVPEDEIDEALEQLVKSEIIFKEEMRYMLNSQIQRIDQTTDNFKSFFKWELNRSIRRISKINEEAFFHCSFSVKPEDFPALREELKKVLTKFTVYRKDGTEIVSLSTILTKV